MAPALPSYAVVRSLLGLEIKGIIFELKMKSEKNEITYLNQLVRVIMT